MQNVLNDSQRIVFPIRLVDSNKEFNIAKKINDKMEEILDKPAVDPSKSKFSRRSFKFSILSFGATVVIVFLTYFRIYFYKNFRPNLFTRNTFMEIVTTILPLLVLVFGIVALVNAIFSITQKEPTSYKKGVGIVWSSIVALLLLAILVANIYDWYK